MITADKLTKRFGDKVAVDGLTFEVEKGEILGFLGPNAAGKTTTMRILTGYFPPSSGSAKVAGYDVARESMEVRRRIGYMPELVPLYPEMKVHEFLEFAAAAKGIPHADRTQAVHRAIERCNLDSVVEQLIATISRGFRQRVGLAQAILNEPEVLILDEPTVGLDPQQIRDIRELIRELAQKATVILSTHILPEVSATCNRVIIIADGQIRAMDTPANLTSRLQGGARILLQVGGGGAAELEVRSVLGRVDGVRKVVPIDEKGRYQIESEPDVDVRADLSRAVVGRDWDLLQLHQEAMTLEDIFLTIVRKQDAAPEEGEEDS
ncbi:MAG: ATP-binding cassette domain-containing protein [Armatimonadetes bacterium]|nr:ATP-binding cassette domain-containing protein [Armatimonadota bacterium]